MKSINPDDVRKYVDHSIIDLQKKKMKALRELKFDSLLNKNPYLYKAKNTNNVGEIIKNLVEEYFAIIDEKIIGDFLIGLAVFIAGKTGEGYSSTLPGVDLEFLNKEVHYLVSIKPGPNWGDRAQEKKLEKDLKSAAATIKEQNHSINVQQVLGICYGNARTDFIRGYLKVVGQNFWYLISENKNLYTEIVVPIGHLAKVENEDYDQEKGAIMNLFFLQFFDRFCDSSGMIVWEKVVEFNSGNYDLDKYI